MQSRVQNGAVLRKYFADKQVKVKVEFSWGSTEVKARLVDAIVDITETSGVTSHTYTSGGQFIYVRLGINLGRGRFSWR